MQNNRGNMRVNDKRMKYRKRNRSISGQFLFAITVILVIFVFCIRDIKAELKEIQVMLKRVEVLQYGRNETEHKEEASAIEGELDYIGSIGSVDVEKPVQRTKEEAIMFAAAMLYAKNIEFPYEIELSEEMVKTDVADINNMKICKHSEPHRNSDTASSNLFEKG